VPAECALGVSRNFVSGVANLVTRDAPSASKRPPRRDDLRAIALPA
jgi:hypothetical protein